MAKPKSVSSILVIDDDDSVRSVVELCLKHAGHKVVPAFGRGQVLALLQEQKFDLIITDVLMPDLDGPEVIRAVKKHQPEAAILAMSGGGAHMTPEFCLSLARSIGAGTPLMKPFHLDELLMAVDQALNTKRAPEAITH